MAKKTLNDFRAVRAPTDPEALSRMREIARLDRDRADAARAQFELEREKGLHILRADVAAEMAGLGETVKAILLSWSGSLPAKLEGLGAAEIAAIVRDEAEKVLHLLASSKIGGGKR
jgi:hypothetical protein